MNRQSEPCTVWGEQGGHERGCSDPSHCTRGAEPCLVCGAYGGHDEGCTVEINQLSKKDLAEWLARDDTEHVTDRLEAVYDAFLYGCAGWMSLPRRELRAIYLQRIGKDI